MVASLLVADGGLNGHVTVVPMKEEALKSWKCLAGDTYSSCSRQGLRVEILSKMHPWLALAPS